MYLTIYNFIQSFLFDGITTQLSANTIEFSTTLLTCFIIGFMIYLATIPFKWLFGLLGR